MVDVSNFLLWIAVASGVITGLLVFWHTRDVSLSVPATLLPGFALVLTSGFLAMLIGYFNDVTSMASIDDYGAYGLAIIIFVYWVLVFKFCKSRISTKRRNL